MRVSGGDEKRAAQRGCPFRGPSKEQKRGLPSLSGDKMGLIRRSILIPTKFVLGRTTCSPVIPADTKTK